MFTLYRVHTIPCSHDTVFIPYCVHSIPCSHRTVFTLYRVGTKSYPEKCEHSVSLCNWRFCWGGVTKGSATTMCVNDLFQFCAVAVNTILCSLYTVFTPNRVHTIPCSHRNTVFTPYRVGTKSYPEKCEHSVSVCN